MELAALPSPPGEERAVADAVTRYLRDLGLQVEEDDAGAKVGSTMGNLFCRVEPNGDGGTPIFLCAHLDTVPPDGALEPVLEDGVIRNAGGTILGADNKSAVAAMLEGARRVLAENRPHAGIELLFTPKEEVGLARRGRLRPRAAARARRLRLRPGGADRRRDPRRAVSRRRSGSLPRPRGPFRDVSGGGPLGDRRGGPRDRRPPARPHRRRDDGERRDHPGRTPGNIIPEWCIARRGGAVHDERKLGELVQEMVDAFSFAAGLEDCEVETKMSKSYRGYRFKRGRAGRPQRTCGAGAYRLHAELRR